MRHALLDFVRRSAVGGEAPIYSEEDLHKCIDRIETIDVHQKIEVSLLVPR
jgi:Cft2 family RNA processing exonuclease